MASDCIGGTQGTSGFDIVGAVSQIGDVVLPVVAINGDEFHVFGLASARGGNAVDTIDYWAVVIREGAAWGAPSLPVGCRLTRFCGIFCGPPASLPSSSRRIAQPAEVYKEWTD